MLFISKTLWYSFCACVRNILKLMTFVIEKMKLVSFSLFLNASPLNPRCPLNNNMSPYSYTEYVKGVSGLGGGEGCTSQRRHQLTYKHRPLFKMVVFIVHQLYTYILHRDRTFVYHKALSHYNALANVCRRMKYISRTLAYDEILLKN